MLKSRSCFIRGVLLCALLATAASVHATPGDAQAVDKARREYQRAMQGHDPGLQNAMRVQLEYQLSLARKRQKPEQPSHSEEDEPKQQHKEASHVHAALPNDTAYAER